MFGFAQFCVCGRWPAEVVARVLSPSPGHDGLLREIPELSHEYRALFPVKQGKDRLPHRIKKEGKAAVDSGTV